MEYNVFMTTTKRYIVSIYEKPPKGAFLRYEGIEADGKRDLREKVAAWNKASKSEYMALHTAFTMN